MGCGCQEKNSKKKSKRFSRKIVGRKTHLAKSRINSITDCSDLTPKQCKNLKMNLAHKAEKNRRAK